MLNNISKVGQTRAMESEQIWLPIKRIRPTSYLVVLKSGAVLYVNFMKKSFGQCTESKLMEKSCLITTKDV